MITTGIKKFFNATTSDTTDGVSDLKTDILVPHNTTYKLQYAISPERLGSGFIRLTSINFMYLVQSGANPVSITTALKRKKYNNGSSDTTTTITTSDSGFGVTNTNYYIGTTTITSPVFLSENDGHQYLYEVSIQGNVSLDSDCLISGLEVVYDIQNILAPTPLYLNSNGTLVSGNFIKYNGNTPTEFNGQYLCNKSGTVSNMYVKLSGTPDGTETYTLTARKNGTNQSLSVAISGSNTSGNDTTHSFSVAAGDLLSVQNIITNGTKVVSVIVTLDIL